MRFEEEENEPVGWCLGMGSIFLGWGWYLGHSVGWLGGIWGWGVFFRDGGGILVTV